jgi:hypothetical protein
VSDDGWKGGDIIPLLLLLGAAPSPITSATSEVVPVNVEDKNNVAHRLRAMYRFN